MKKEKNSKYIIILLVFTVIVTLSTLFGERGLLHLYDLSKKRNSIINDNNALKETNRDLKKKIELLKNDNHYIEKVARKELGMVGRGEIVYHFEN
ncbi:MAG: septum formation initiator family protein [Thermodesulfobacteriota bacterium]